MALRDDETLTVIPPLKDYEVIVRDACARTIKARAYQVSDEGHLTLWLSTGQAAACFAAGQWVAVIQLKVED